ncbi:DUF3568 family protein [bacterium]|nr:DUF3568 family protein [bacterium]
MNMKKLSVVMLVGVVGVASVGCSTIGGRREHIPVTYSGGELQATMKAPLSKVERIVQDVLREMGFSITSREAETNGAKVIADNYRTKKRVVVTLVETEQKTVELGIRVDSSGNKKLSQEIIDAINAKL